MSIDNKQIEAIIEELSTLDELAEINGVSNRFLQLKDTNDFLLLSGNDEGLPYPSRGWTIFCQGFNIVNPQIG